MSKITCLKQNMKIQDSDMEYVALGLLIKSLLKTNIV